MMAARDTDQAVKLLEAWRRAAKYRTWVIQSPDEPVKRPMVHVILYFNHPDPTKARSWGAFADTLPEAITRAVLAAAKGSADG